MTKAATARRKKMLMHATAERDAWLCGFAAALATMNRQHDRPSFIEDALAANGITGFHLQVAGAERDDLRELRKAYKHHAPCNQRRLWHGQKIR